MSPFRLRFFKCNFKYSYHHFVAIRCPSTNCCSVLETVLIISNKEIDTTKGYQGP